MQSIKHLFFVDNLKAFLIILVVLGHCIQNFMSGYESNLLFKFIYSFHMPLFIFVSGFVSYKEHITWHSVGKRFTQLMIPFFAWAVVKSIIRWDPGMIPFIIENPDNGLWFLHTLFFISLIMMICEYAAEKLQVQRYKIVITAGLLLLVSMYGLGIREWGVQSISYFFIFYVAGFYARRDMLFEHLPFYVVVIITILFLCLVPFHNVNGMASFFSEGTNPIYGTAFRVLLAFGGIIGVFTLFKKIAANYSRIGNYIGVRTLGIYAIHPALLNIYLDYIDNSNKMGGVIVFISCICVLITSVIIYELLSKNKFLSIVFLGK